MGQIISFVQRKGAAIYVIYKSEYLLVHKRKGFFGSYGKNKISVPSGIANYREKLIDTAKRELYEESGIVISCNLKKIDKNSFYINLNILPEQKLITSNEIHEWTADEFKDKISLKDKKHHFVKIKELYKRPDIVWEPTHIRLNRLIELLN